MSSMLLSWKRLVSRSNLYRFLLGATPAVESIALPSFSDDDLLAKKRVQTWELLPSGDDQTTDDEASQQHEWRRRRKPGVINLRLSASFDLLLPQESTNIFFRHILAYHQANSSLARALLAQLIIHGFIPDFFTLTLLIESYCKDHNYQKAADAISTQLKVFRVKDDEFFLTPLIYGLSTRIGPNSTYRLLKKLKASNVDVPSFYYSALAHEFCAKKMKNDEKMALNDMEQQYDEALASFIEGCFNDCKGDQLPKAISGLRLKMSEGCIKMNTTRLNIFLSYLRKYGLLGDLLNVFNEYRQMGKIKLDKAAYSTAMECYCKIWNMEEAINLFEEMKAKNMDPDSADYTALVEGYKRLGRLDDMRTIAAEMEKVGINRCSSTV